MNTLRFTGNSESWKKANADPKRLDSPFHVSLLSPQQRQVKVTQLENGVRVVSETPALPGVVTFGVLLEVGTRNETPESSGALFSIQSTKYKTNLHTNETINNHMVEMTGGNYQMCYDRERSLFKASVLSHDVTDVFSMVADCVLEPRSSVTANAAIGKMKDLRKLSSYKYPGLKQTELLFTAIFGEKGLGMPLQGSDSNDTNLNAYMLQKFQIENYSPERIIVGGIGVENHGEFVTLVEEYFANIRYGSQLHTPEKQQFKEVELKIMDAESNKNEIILLYETEGNKSRDFLISALAREYFGYADVANPACIANNHGVFVSDFYNKQKGLHAAEAYNFHFNDVGMFGFRLSTTSDGSNRALDDLGKHLSNLGHGSELHFIRAAKKLKSSIIQATEDDGTRLKELLNHVSAFGESRLDSLLQEIDNLTFKDLKDFLERTIRGNASLLVKGPNVGGAHSLDTIKKFFR